jgi:hypothetical protein
VATLYEVAKQAKYLVAPQLRASVDEYVALLGRLQLNGFEMTSATATATATESELHAPPRGGEADGEGIGKARRKRKKGNEPGEEQGVGGHRPIGIGVFPSVGAGCCSLEQWRYVKHMRQEIRGTLPTFTQA